MQPPAAVWRKHRRLEWSWPFIRVGTGVQQPPRVLRVRLSSSGRKGEPQAYLWRADAERYGLLPASLQPKLEGKEWVPVAFARRPDELLALPITKAGDKLAEESKTALDCRRPLSAGYCTNELRKLHKWPEKPRGSPKQRSK
jgi:hypothetical protein